MHVFIGAGLLQLINTDAGRPLKIFELGFGTGLNALLTLIEADQAERPIYYETLEPFPLNPGEVSRLNYCKHLNRPDLQPVFEKLHDSVWGNATGITEQFHLLKYNLPFDRYTTTGLFNLVYYDAFAPDAQPELWTEEVFRKIFDIMESGGLLVTYCSKGQVRRNMIAAGFSVSKLPGPPGKREMLRAIR